MTTPATLYTATIPLGLGHDAIVTITAEPPLDEPDTGSDWPVEVDYARATLMIYLPMPTYGELAHDLVCLTVEILKQKVGRHWGVPNTTTLRQSRHVTRSGPRRSAIVTELRELAESQLRPLIAHVAARAARLAERARTIELAEST